MDVQSRVYKDSQNPSIIRPPRPAADPSLPSRRRTQNFPVLLIGLAPDQQVFVKADTFIAPPDRRKKTLKRLRQSVDAMIRELEQDGHRRIQAVIFQPFHDYSEAHAEILKLQTAFQQMGFGPAESGSG